MKEKKKQYYPWAVEVDDRSHFTCVIFDVICPVRSRTLLYLSQYLMGPARVVQLKHKILTTHSSRNFGIDVYIDFVSL
jgi:hypothetical protein